jgi:hypothetical protein
VGLLRRFPLPEPTILTPIGLFRPDRLWILSGRRAECEKDSRSNSQHRRIRSKSYAKGSGMIPRLDVAVDRRRRARPVWRAALCGQHAAPEPVTDRLRGTIPILAARANLSRPRNGARKVPRPHRFARLGTHRLQRRLRLAVRTAQTEGSGPAKAALRVPSMPLTVRFRTDSAMTPTSPFFSYRPGRVSVSGGGEERGEPQADPGCAFLCLPALGRKEPVCQDRPSDPEGTPNPLPSSGRHPATSGLP